MYVLGEYLITYDASIKVEMFSEKDYHGIYFFMEDGQYQLINNFHMGPRMIINLKNGYNHDIPFKPATFSFLPPGVTACEMNKEPFIHVSFAR